MSSAVYSPADSDVYPLGVITSKLGPNMDLDSLDNDPEPGALLDDEFLASKSHLYMDPYHFTGISPNISEVPKLVDPADDVVLQTPSITVTGSNGPSLAPFGFEERADTVFGAKMMMPMSVEGLVVVSDASSGTQHSSCDNSHSISDTSISSQDVYSHIREAPWFATRIDFRQFHTRKPYVPQAIQLEPSVGLFVGQLPNSYSEDDIKAMLYAIAHHSGTVIQARSVKSHGVDRTCAFVMLNSGALSALLPYNKRILCDVNCFWVVEPSRAHFLPLVVDQTARQCLRGVPKAPLVLEKLVPQSKARSANRSNGANNSSRQHASRHHHPQAQPSRHAARPRALGGQGFAMPMGGYTAAAWNSALPVVGSSPWITAANPTIFCPMTNVTPPMMMPPPQGGFLFAGPPPGPMGFSTAYGGATAVMSGTPMYPYLPPPQ